MIRKELMKAHHALAVGSPEDMLVANLIFRLLHLGHLTLGMSDADCQTLTMLEDLGVHIRYVWSWAHVTL